MSPRRLPATRADPHLDWPTGDLYHSPLGLFPFQAEAVARAYLGTEQGGGRLIVHDAGLGKTHFGLRMSTLLAEDAAQGQGQHDLTVIVCERNKITEWRDDVLKFTRQSVRVHHGPNRMRTLAQEGLPEVLVTTYETAKADFTTFVKPPGRRGMVIEAGPLFEAISGRSVLWVCDEVAKLRNRTSATYKAFWWVFGQRARSHPDTHRVFGLTATPIEKDYQDAFNQMRLLVPGFMTVKVFEDTYVSSMDDRGHIHYRAEMMADFAARCAPYILRKRKSDPDVIDQFPKKVEESHHITMGPQQAALYDLVASLQPEDDPEPLPGLWTALRQVAAHPASLIASAGSSAIAGAVVAELGADYLRGVPSAKEEALLAYLEPIVKGQGAKAVVFTFFGQSVLPLLAGTLRRHGFLVYENHGGLSATEMGAVRARFKTDPRPCVFLTSDAGSRGVNLPEATYVLEFDSALTYANRTQRLDRIHRIDAQSESVTCMTFVLDETVEVPILERVIARNRQSDILLGDNDAGEMFMTASERRAALRVSGLTKRARRTSAA